LQGGFDVSNYIQGHPDILVTTAFELPEHRTVKVLGIVRGITVRTRGIGPQFVAGLQTLVGGRVGAYVSMCEYAREEALQFMLTHAREMGANAIIGMRYDATELGQGKAEVLAYGTAVVAEPNRTQP
jgi:uncharacterized protein YbjQ (UPF0145 family)